MPVPKASVPNLIPPGLADATFETRVVNEGPTQTCCFFDMRDARLLGFQQKYHSEKRAAGYIVTTIFISHI